MPGSGSGAPEPVTRERVAAVIARQPWDLHSARLDLLPLRRAHAPLLFDLLREPALYLHTGGAPPPTLAYVEKWFTGWESRRAPDGSELWLNWTVRVRDAGDAVGYVQATIGEDARADLAWVIGLPHQGRGYASEAARAVLEWLVGLGVSRFRACIKPAHVASQVVAQRLGLRRSGQWVDDEEAWLLDVGES